MLIGVLTVAQFCPEPMSAAAQTFLASTAGPVRRGTATPQQKAFAQQAGRLLLSTSAGLGVGLAAFAGAVARFAPGLFTSDPMVMARVATLAPLLSAAILLYTMVSPRGKKKIYMHKRAHRSVVWRGLYFVTKSF